VVLAVEYIYLFIKYQRQLARRFTITVLKIGVLMSILVSSSLSPWLIWVKMSGDQNCGISCELYCSCSSLRSPLCWINFLVPFAVFPLFLLFALCFHFFMLNGWGWWIMGCKGCGRTGSCRLINIPKSVWTGLKKSWKYLHSGIAGASANTEILHLLSAGRKRTQLVPAPWFFRYE
jgi:hypothetical protein